MATLSFTLSEPMRDWVEARVASGRYVDASDYVRDLIRHDQAAQDELQRLAEIDEKIAAGLADVEAGRVYDADEVFDRLKAKYDAMGDERRAG